MKRLTVEQIGTATGLCWGFSMANKAINDLLKYGADCIPYDIASSIMASNNYVSSDGMIYSDDFGGYTTTSPYYSNLAMDGNSTTYWQSAEKTDSQQFKIVFNKLVSMSSLSIKTKYAIHSSYGIEIARITEDGKLFGGSYTKGMMGAGAETTGTISFDNPNVYFKELKIIINPRDSSTYAGICQLSSVGFRKL